MNLHLPGWRNKRPHPHRVHYTPLLNIRSLKYISCCAVIKGAERFIAHGNRRVSLAEGHHGGQRGGTIHWRIRVQSQARSEEYTAIVRSTEGSYDT